MENAQRSEPESEFEKFTSGFSRWRPSRYNLFAPIPGTDRFAGINLFHGSCDTYTGAELYLLSEVEFLHAEHPILERFRKRGLIVNFDELEALDCMGRLSPAAPYSVNMTICPTMGCNFDCPYCFLKHWNSRMSREVQDDVAALAERMLDASGAKLLRIRWFGGEPLLTQEIVESLSERLMKAAGERGAEYKALMYTNGYLLTQETVDMLERCGIGKITVTVDGLGKTHDATRHLAGGGSTFERITGNLRNLRMPFRVEVRQILHQGNRDEAGALEELVRRIGEESGNHLKYNKVPARLIHMKNPEGITGLSGEEYCRSGIQKFAWWFGPATARFCEAGSVWAVGVNSEGRLFRCWEQQDDSRFSYGSAHDWDPRDPIRTADRPDLFSALINRAVPSRNPACRECVWLPLCCGECPFHRLEYGETCIRWKDRSDEFVLAVYEEMKKRAAAKDGAARAEEEARGFGREEDR